MTSDTDSRHSTKLHEQLDELISTEAFLHGRKEELDRQLNEIKNSIVAVHRHVEEKRSEIHGHENSLNPIVSFPPELLSIVFLAVVCFEDVPVSKTGNPYPMTLALASVCRRWRDIVLGDPRLWSHIDIGHSSHYNSHLYLSLSADRPLDITLLGPLAPSYWSAWLQVAMLCRNSLIIEAWRWRRLRVEVTDMSQDDFGPFLSQEEA